MAKNNNVVDFGAYKKHKGFVLNIGYVVIFIIFLYMIINAVQLSKKTVLVRYEVRKGALSIPNTYEGLILRDETVVRSQGAGYINTFAKEGEHVAYNDLVYSLDSSGRISDMILGDESGINFSDDDYNNFENDLINFQNEFSLQNFSSMYSFKNQMDSEVLKISNYNILDNLEKIGQAKEQVSLYYVPQSGLISYNIDGDEGLRPQDIDADKFDHEKYESTHVEANQLIKQGDPIYKIINSENWSIVFPCDALQAEEFENEQYVKVRFLKNQYESWASVSRFENAGQEYVKLDFTNSCITFASSRFAQIEILSYEDEGLKVPNSAICEQQFYLIPVEYLSEGGKNDQDGFLRETYDENGKVSLKHVDVNIYYADDQYYYVDTSTLKIGDYICKTDSKDKYPISKVGTLIGVYNVNKGYADFTAITILYSNEEYSIVKSNTSYGLNEYDYIILNANEVNPDDFVVK